MGAPKRLRACDTARAHGARDDSGVAVGTIRVEGRSMTRRDLLGIGTAMDGVGMARRRRGEVDLVERWRMEEEGTSPPYINNKYL